MNLEKHLSNFLETMKDDITKKLQAVPNEDQAFVRIAANWLGYDELEDDDDERFVDGSGDKGIDFWYESEPGFDIIQVKSHELSKSGDILTDNFDKTGVNDLQRAVNYLLDDKQIINKENKRLHFFRQQWESAINRKKGLEPIHPLQVSLILVLFGDGLTDPANGEFDSFKESLSLKEYRGVPIEFRSNIMKLKDILIERWKEDNREWRDRFNNKRDYIDLRPMPYKKNKEPWLSAYNSVIFYCKAIDLIKAYDDFGYQIFEPNVRAHVGKTKVNMSIRDSLIHQKTRHEFMYLNNGVTITCKTIHNPSANANYFRAFYPGVINGLQTVVALSESYSGLTLEDDRNDLEDNCYVLVRLLGEKAVDDINRVVIASNTQNTMQPRNLKSNNSEQIYYEKLFAELGWFYSRKQGAWNAFYKNPKGWRTLKNFNKDNFRVSGLGGGARYRVADNEDIAQAWLSFIGFCNEAVHKKKFIFEEYYQIVFLQRTIRHGIDYNYLTSLASEEAIPESPSHTMLLVSFLARELAKKISLSSKENREHAFKRLKIDIEGRPKELIDHELTQDHDYLLEQALSSMTLVFVESFGYILFKALGERIHDIGLTLLNNRSFKKLKEKADFYKIADDIRNESTKEDDIVSISWYAFRHVIDQMMASSWKQSYLTARNRTRFNHSSETRSKIYKELDHLDEFMKRTQVTQPWAAGIPAKIGLYKHFKKILWE